MPQSKVGGHSVRETTQAKQGGGGGILSEKQHRRTVEPREKNMAHKLLRTASGDTSTEIVHKEQETVVSPPENKQLHGSSLYQQPRQHCFDGVDLSYQGSANVVSGGE